MARSEFTLVLQIFRADKTTTKIIPDKARSSVNSSNRLKLFSQPCFLLTVEAYPMITRTSITHQNFWGWSRRFWINRQGLARRLGFTLISITCLKANWQRTAQRVSGTHSALELLLETPDAFLRLPAALGTALGLRSPAADWGGRPEATAGGVAVKETVRLNARTLAFMSRVKTCCL